VWTPSSSFSNTEGLSLSAFKVFLKAASLNQWRLGTAAIPALGKLKQKYDELEVNLGYRGSSRLA
jgi:hypothetical protein